ncbi:Uncharacterised protein [Yersinia frederiksenii]|nr:Uncharacterised protein [Yersinia frederiksenii]
MQIDMVKNAGGVFVPAFDHDLPRLTKFKNGEMTISAFATNTGQKPERLKNFRRQPKCLLTSTRQ